MFSGDIYENYKYNVLSDNAVVQLIISLVNNSKVDMTDRLNIVIQNLCTLYVTVLLNGNCSATVRVDFPRKYTIRNDEFFLKGLNV